MRADLADGFAYMVDHIVDASPPRGRIEVRTGIGRRRRWSEDEKGRIVAQSFAPGAVVSEVARRHELTPQHLFVWRKAARGGRLALPAEDAPCFVPVVVGPQNVARTTKPAAGSITIEIADAVVRAERGVDVGWLADVLRAVRAAT
jgi:transposase